MTKPTTTDAGELSLVRMFTSVEDAAAHAREVGLIVFTRNQRGNRVIAIAPDGAEAFFLGGTGEERMWDRMRLLEPTS